MKIIVIVVFGVIILSVSIPAQVSPVPVTDTEVRDSTSIRMRSLEFERAKRDANEPHRNPVSNLSPSKFAAIKKDFAAIQELEAAIVKAYETGAKINYGIIGDLALNMKKRATRLRANFFDIKDRAEEDKDPEVTDRKSVRDLIIELDGTLAVFVGSPLFTNPQLINAKSADEAKADLDRLIRLSYALHRAAARMKH